MLNTRIGLKLQSPGQQNPSPSTNSAAGGHISAPDTLLSPQNMLLFHKAAETGISLPIAIKHYRRHILTLRKRWSKTCFGVFIWIIDKYINSIKIYHEYIHRVLPRGFCWPLSCVSSWETKMPWYCKASSFLILNLPMTWRACDTI